MSAVLPTGEGPGMDIGLGLMMAGFSVVAVMSVPDEAATAASAEEEVSVLASS